MLRKHMNTFSNYLRRLVWNWLFQDFVKEELENIADEKLLKFYRNLTRPF